MRSRKEEVIFGTSGRGNGFYPQPRYGEFDREPGLVYTVFVDEEVADTLASLDAIEFPFITELLAEPHYECKLVAKERDVSFALTDQTQLLVWVRRPRQYAATMPYMTINIGDPIVLMSRATTEAAIFATIAAVYDLGATGFWVIDIDEIQPALNVAGDLQRVYRGRGIGGQE